MKSISLEEHEKYGELFKILNKKLHEDMDQIFQEVKSKTQGRLKTKRHKKIIEALTTIRNQMEEIMFSDHVGGSTDIYYGSIIEKGVRR